MFFYFIFDFELVLNVSLFISYINMNTILSEKYIITAPSIN